MPVAGRRFDSLPEGVSSTQSTWEEAFAVASNFAR
jgi:hypothetical protein